MLRGIPLSLLTTSGELIIPFEVDSYKNLKKGVEKFERAYFEVKSDTVKKKDNTEIRAVSTLFWDFNKTKPRIDLLKLKSEIEDVGGFLRFKIEGLTYEVDKLEIIKDDRGRIHHYEISLI